MRKEWDVRNSIPAGKNARFVQPGPILFRLNAFRNQRHSQGVYEWHKTGYQILGTRIQRRRLNKRAVELELIQRILLKVRQRRIAHTEVVGSDLNPALVY